MTDEEKRVIVMAEQKGRVIMSRPARKAFDTNYFHVIVQGIGKEKIFETGRLKSEYLNDLQMFKAFHGIKILTYCVMDNHCHLLVYSPSAENLGAYMRRVNTRYAQYYNHIRDRVGYVFRDRYKSQAVFEGDYLINCMVYIHNNPVKAGIVQNAADYTYSGLQCYYSHTGGVDFDEAEKFFDTDADNVEAIMEEKSACADENCPFWIEAEEEKRSGAEIAREIVAACGDVLVLRKDRERLKKIVAKMRAAGCNMSDIAKALGVARSVLFDLLK